MERIIKAVLEVFAKQPLPEDSKLWKLPNVIITPRIAGMTSQTLPAVLPPIPRADIWITRRTGSVFVETIDKSL